MIGLEAVMLRLASDPDFRSKFGEDSDSALAAYALTGPERQLLMQCRPLLALTSQALHARWNTDSVPGGPLWWDSMSAPDACGA